MSKKHKKKESSEPEKFKFYELRKDLYKEVKIKEDTYRLMSKVPYDVMTKVFMFLDEKENVKTRLLSKKFSVYSEEYWKMICCKSLEENDWLPQVNFEKMKQKYHSFEFYRKFIYPLLYDKRLIEENYKKKKIDPKKIKSAFKSGILFDTEACLTKPEVGITRFGGIPDLPDSILWPEGMEFLCQINLSDEIFLTSFSPQEYNLPKGILFFFVDKKNWSGKVIYNENIKECKLQKEPKWISKHSCKIYNKREVKTFEILGYPDRIEEYNIYKFYSDIHFPYFQKKEIKSGVPNHFMFGNYKYPSCEIFKDEEEMVLLLQVDSDHNIGFQWADMGVIYFRISKQDLMNVKENPSLWDNVQLIIHTA